MDHLRPQIDGLIEQLATEYRAAPASILTENDLQCLLVSRLLNLNELRGTRPTLDASIQGTMVHSEVSWFDENGRLRLKPDITILEPGHMSIMTGIGGVQLPRKGFHFGGRAIIFELKLVRGRSGITSRSVASIRGDLAKIDRLLRKIETDGAREDLFCYFVVFSKVDRRSPGFYELLAQYATNDRLSVVYHSANVIWPRNHRGTAPNRRVQRTPARGHL